MGLFHDWIEFCKSSNGGHGNEDIVDDGSLDIKGRPTLRAKSGGWKASLFIIGVEFSERLTYYAIASNLIIYLTTVMHEGLEEAAKDVNNWAGVTACIPLVGGFLADAYFGRYWMVLISTIIYILGLILLAISVSISSLRPAPLQKTTPKQKGVLFLALYMIAVGTGGHKPSLQSFGADQFDEGEPSEKGKKASFFNWWYCGLCSGAFIGLTVVVYIEDNVGWGVGFSIPVATMLIALVIFFLGTPYYRNMVARGSPLTGIAQVFFAAFRNRHEKLPTQADKLYETWDPEMHKLGQRFLFHTQSLRFLDKAAIAKKAGDTSTSGEKTSPWRLCTVTQVEETKLVVRLVPIWFSLLVYGMCIAQGTTFFIKQGATMDRSMGPHFDIPPASLFGISGFSMAILAAMYDKILVPVARRFTGSKRGISLLQRIGTGLFFIIIAMGSAALIERKRVSTASSSSMLDKPKAQIPMSVFWLVPQFLLLGLADVFTLVGMQEYFYDQVLDNMRSLGISLYLGVVGVGSFLSSLLITIVSKATRLRGHQSWFQVDINKSHLDYFYWLLAGLSTLNLLVFVFFARSILTSKSTPKGLQKKMTLQIKCNMLELPTSFMYY